MYTIENGGQYFEPWSPSYKVQSREKRPEARGGDVSMELQGCSLDEPQKSTVDPIAPENISLPSSLSPAKDKSTRDKLTIQETFRFKYFVFKYIIRSHLFKD